jgi:hypothetical protein
MKLVLLVLTANVGLLSTACSDSDEPAASSLLLAAIPTYCGASRSSRWIQ